MTNSPLMNTYAQGASISLLCAVVAEVNKKHPFIYFSIVLLQLTSRGGLCNARFELFYLFNYLIEFRVFLNNLFDL